MKKLAVWVPTQTASFSYSFCLLYGTGPWALIPSLPLLALEQRLGLGGELPLGDGQLLFRIHAEALIATLRAVDLNTAALGDNQGR